MKIESKWKGDMLFRANSPSHHTTDLDSGPKDSVTNGPSPMEAVLQSIAACSGMDIISILHKKRKEPEKFEISVTGERAETHPKVYTKIEIEYRFEGSNLTQKDVEQAVKLSVDKYCSVLAMVRSTAEIEYRIELKN